MLQQQQKECFMITHWKILHHANMHVIIQTHLIFLIDISIYPSDILIMLETY